MLNLGERIRAARIMAGLSQRALAAKLGVSAMTISKWERNLVSRDAFPTSRLLRIAEATGRKVEYFLRPVRVEVLGALHWPTGG